MGQTCRHVALWPVTSLAAMRRFGCDWGTSGHCPDIANRSLVTHMRHPRKTTLHTDTCYWSQLGGRLSVSWRAKIGRDQVERKLPALLAADVRAIGG